VVHAVGDGDAGREAVVDDAAGARREQLGQRAEQLGILLRLGVDRAGQLTLDAPDRVEQLVAVAVAQQHDDRPEVLLEQLGAVGDRRRGRLVGGRLVAVTVAGERRRRAERPHLRPPRQPLDRGGERVAQALVEQHRRLDAVQPRRDRARELVSGRAARDEDDAGLRAQLAAEARHRRDEPVGDRVAARGQRGLGHDDRVHGAHLRVDRDRVRPARCAVGDRAAARRRAGEADGGDRGRVDERLADLDAGGEQVRERPLRQPGVVHRRPQLARDDLARARVRRMTLDHDRAAGRERRDGVAAGGREREREVARAEHGDWPDRDEHPPDVGARDRLGVRVGRVDDRLDVVARLEQGRERLELAGGALELAPQPRLRQPGLAAGDGDDLVAGGAQSPGGGAQQRGASAAVAQRWIVERALGGVDRGGDVSGRRLVVGGDRNARRGVDGIESRRHAVYGTRSRDRTSC
jgi:hypothetical protein